MPRLLFLTERFPPEIGGVASSAGRLSRAFASLGVSVDILTWTRRLPPGEVQSEESLYRLGKYRQWDMTLLQTQNVIEWLHESHRYDLIWGHYLLPSGFMAAYFGGLREIPSIVSIRGNDVDREMFPPGDFSRVLWTLQHATHITSVTTDLARKARVLAGRSDVQVLWNAVDLDLFQPGPPDPALRQALDIRPNEVVLGFSGELREKKGMPFLLEALRRVQERYDARLLVIGDVRASQMPVLQQFADEYPDGHERLTVTGHLEDPAAIAAHLRLCDLFLLPSLWEGMPNSLLEAMACGCTVIASDAGGIPEAITHGVDGFLLPRGQLHRLGNAALEWLDSDRPAAIGQAARARVERQFSFAQERIRLQAVLDRALSSVA